MKRGGIEGGWNASKNGVMIAPKRERSTSDVVQLARQKVSMGTFDRSLCPVNLQISRRLPENAREKRLKVGAPTLIKKRQAFNRKFFNIVFIEF